ncbi:SacI domain-containing protein [Lophium mytilinum]|uniref:SacI domain-containing protein n=1 Tax=Lophium mytilinum TaxID=390894 RepID=A0A6A6QZW0_9PEZI|nr:SacI domain-containing protein [Lophium mytilinum]
MPPLVRKLLIFAAVDGLILQPAPPRNHPPATQQAIKIDYKGNVAPLLKDRRETDTTPVSLEAHGIVGLLKVASATFLISICGREQVAQVRGKPIYVITDVALIPLSSQEEAHKAITAAKEHVKRHAKADEAGVEEDSESDDDESRSIIGDSLDEEATPPVHEEIKDTVTGQRGPLERQTSVVEDVIGKKGVYGRFADKWFSKRGWSAEGRRMQGMSSEEDISTKKAQTPPNVESTLEESEEAPKGPVNPEDAPEGVKEEVEMPVSPEEIPKALVQPVDSSTVELLPKILRTTKLYFSSRSFFFSYDYDVSRSLGRQQGMGSSLPLFKQFDPLFFWNRHIMSPLIDAGQHTFVLPLIQGFVGQRAFTVDVSGDSSKSAVVDSASKPEDVIAAQPEADSTDTSPSTAAKPPATEEPGKKDFLLTIISRRSIKRAGLRYLRRGVDDEGNAANSVETEQILSTTTWDSTEDKIYSFTQYRGSIPLFFSQSPYSLKPLPMFFGSPETNAAAFKLHFATLASRYGSIYCASLVDKHGTESKIGGAFEKHAGELNSDGGIDSKGTQLGFEWFDFHNVCRGMRFENVSLLIDTLGPFLTTSGFTVISNDKPIQTQSGVLRTNCMDCLDRTNVVQSACARTALESQLASHSPPIHIDLHTDPSTAWFNTLWADNGDAISKQYAGTAALKGDFTRTRKRGVAGALADFGLTLNRYYNNIVDDYFAQALIDYLLGRAPDSIFAEFEADMKSADYAVDLRKVRQAAIERCAGIVIEDPEEDLVAGWTLSCPSAANSLKTARFEEAVLLLTEHALYFCRLDWGTEKVAAFERIALDQLDAVSRGVYITSTLAKRHVNETKNVGFVLRYRAELGKELVRVNTRSLDSGVQESAAKGKEEGRFLAFKALPPKSSFGSGEGAEEAESEGEVVKLICEEIVAVANKARKGEREAAEGKGEGAQGWKPLAVEEKDVVSLVDAKKSTGYLEQLGYSLKKFVWA